MTASLIIPVTVANPALFYMATVALRTSRATTPAAEILCLINNSPNPDLRDALERQCQLLDVRAESWERPFSLSACFNHGTAQTNGDLIAWCGQDIVFYHGWLEAMERAFADHPNFRILWPWSFDWRDFGVSFRPDYRPAVGIEPTHWPSGALIMMRRSDNYHWDEQFSRWELDADLCKEMEAKGWKGACVLGARVDHLVEAVNDQIDVKVHYGLDKFELQAAATTAFRQKWRL